MSYYNEKSYVREYPTVCNIKLFISSFSFFNKTCKLHVLMTCLLQRDQSHLTALTHPSGTSIVAVILRACLGLSAEFVAGLHLLLEISIFPLSSIYTCLSPIDNFGDHLLGCSHGPMRIRHYVNLVNIIYSTGHPGVY